MSVVYPELSSAVPWKSCLSVQAGTDFPWPPEEMKDLIVYSKVANTSSRAACRDVSSYSETETSFSSAPCFEK